MNAWLTYKQTVKPTPPVQAPPTGSTEALRGTASLCKANFRSHDSSGLPVP